MTENTPLVKTTTRHTLLFLWLLVGASLQALTILVTSPTANAQQHSSPRNLIAVHRFYNTKNGVHFYTASEHEANTVKSTLKSTYRDEGVGFHAYSAPKPGYKKVHRFYNFKQGVHFYTSNQSEATVVNNTLSHIYRYEGVAYYTPPANKHATVHRFYNFKQGVHFYTVNQKEATKVNNTMSHTYRYEGVSHYATPPRHFKDCTTVIAAGAAPLYRGEPGYGTHLDRDRDGIACERN